MFADLKAGPVEFVGKWNFFYNSLTLHVGLNFGGIMLSVEYYI